MFKNHLDQNVYERKTKRFPYKKYILSGDDFKMENIKIPADVQLTVEQSPKMAAKMTHENIADGKLQTKRNECIEKILKQAQNQGLAIAKEPSKVKLAKDEAEVQTIDFATEIEPKLDKVTPMAFPKQLVENVEKVNLAVARAAANDNPNGAYTIALETLYTDSISAVNEQRWYNFQITAKKKLTAYMSSVAVATIDNDLMLYKLDTSTYTLNLVSKSQNRAGMYELLSYIAEPGIYYLCVAAYACSAPNNFNFLARISDTWDAEEADDSMALAKEQVVNKVVKRTLDNSIDEDCTIWLVEKTGNYRLEFFGVPANCNYQLQILNANQEIMTTISKNTSTNFKNVAAAGYFVRVLAPDGVVEPTAQYGVLFVRIPDGVDFSKYMLWFAKNKDHFVECIIANETLFAIFGDGKPIDPQELTFESTRTATIYNKHVCRGRGLDTSSLVGVHLGSYGSKAPTVNGTKDNTLMLVLNTGYFSTYHMSRVYNKSDWPNTPDDELIGYDQNHQKYYQGYWNQGQEVPIAFIVDIDQGGMCIDLYSPNWFYGTRDRYGVGQESASFVSTFDLGAGITPPDHEE